LSRAGIRSVTPVHAGRRACIAGVRQHLSDDDDHLPTHIHPGAPVNACILFLCLSFGGRDAPQPRDPFFAEDKFKHFVTSFIVTSLASSGARAAGLDHDTALLVGVGTGAAVGIGKEVHDLGRENATASFNDIVWDLAGVGAAAAVQSRSQ
jgi:uncharacterized protein YfiM (DUF2279 family)